MVNCTAAIRLSWFRVFVYLVSWFLVFSLLPWLPCDFVYLGLLTYPCASVPCVTLSTPHLIQFISFISLVIVCFDFTCPLLYLTNYILILLFRLVPVCLLFVIKNVLLLYSLASCRALGSSSTPAALHLHRPARAHYDPLLVRLLMGYLEDKWYPPPRAKSYSFCVAE